MCLVPPSLSFGLVIMPLSPQEKALVDRILNEEIQWRVQRWFALLAVLAMSVLGYFLTERTAAHSESRHHFRFHRQPYCLVAT